MTDLVQIPAPTDRTAPALFTFKGAQLRVVDRQGEPWFVAADVAAALGLRDANRATRLLDDDEKGAHSVGTLGGAQSMQVISESGLYALVLRSRKPEARPFQKWVTAVVLPTIRRHGMYVAGEEQPLPEDMTEEDVRVQMAALQDRLQAIEAEKVAAARARHLEHKADRFYALRAMRRRG